MILWVDNHIRTLVLEPSRLESNRFTQSAGERREYLAGSAAGARCVRGGGRSVTGVPPPILPMCDQALSWEKGRVLIQGAGLWPEVFKC